MKLRAPVVLALLLAGSVVMTFLYWRGISFGVRLDDAELAEALADDAPSRKALHGLEEVTERLVEQRPGMDRWTERMVAVSHRPEANVRQVAAWAMHLAVRDPAVAARLREMTAGDPDELTRRNAACSLSLAEDPTGALPVLRSMLEPYRVRAVAAGEVESLGGVGRRPKEGDLLGRLRGPDGERVEIVAPLPGTVVETLAEEGARVAAGDPLVVLSPDASHVMNAARALAGVGTREDAELLRPFLAPASGMPDDVVAQVRAAVQAIEARGR